MRLYDDETELSDLKIKQQQGSSAEQGQHWAGRSAASMFAGIFSAFSNATTKTLLTESKLIYGYPPAVIVFPVAAAIDIIDAEESWREVYTSKNKNLGKILNASAKTQKAVMVAAAVTVAVSAKFGVAVGTLGLMVPWVFVVTLGSLAVYETVLFARATVNYVLSENGSELKRVYRDKMITHGTKAVAFFALSAVVAVLMGLTLGQPIVIAAAVVGVAVALGMIGFGIALHIRHNNRLKAAKARNLSGLSEKVDTTKSFKTITEMTTVTHKEVRVDIQAKGHARFHATYEYQHNYAKVLNSVKKFDTRKEVFAKIMDAKIDDLEKQRDHAVGFDSWFSSIGRDEISKRQQKINALNELKKLVSESNEDAKVFNDEVDAISHKYSRVFQSFFKNKGEVETLFDAAKEYFAVERPQSRFKGGNQYGLLNSSEAETDSNSADSTKSFDNESLQF